MPSHRRTRSASELQPVADATSAAGAAAETGCIVSPAGRVTASSMAFGAFASSQPQCGSGLESRERAWRSVCAVGSVGTHGSLAEGQSQALQHGHRHNSISASGPTTCCGVTNLGMSSDWVRPPSSACQSSSPLCSHSASGNRPHCRTASSYSRATSFEDEAGGSLPVHGADGPASPFSSLLFAGPGAGTGTGRYAGTGPSSMPHASARSMAEPAANPRSDSLAGSASGSTHTAAWTAPCTHFSNSCTVILWFNDPLLPQALHTFITVRRGSQADPNQGLHHASTCIPCTEAPRVLQGLGLIICLGSGMLSKSVHCCKLCWCIEHAPSRMPACRVTCGC